VNLKKRAIFPNSEKIKYWLKLITVTGTAQVIVQAVGFLSGILVIRLLSVDEYALYTLANTMLGTMTVLSDGGISTGVMAQGGKIWQDRQKLGTVMATGLDLRRKFAIFSLIVSIPILGYLLLHHGASWVMTVLITASLIPAFYASLSDGILQIPVKLHQAIVPLQRNQVEVSVGRLLLTAITLFAFPWAFVAIIASGIPRIWGNVKLRKIAERVTDKEQNPDAEERREILKIVRKILPTVIFYSISGQINIWIISFFGNTKSVAQIGALGRFSILFSILSTMINVLIIPRFTRLNKVKIFKFFLWYQLCFFFGGFFVAIFVKFIPYPFLFILGKTYYGLENELLLVTLIALINLLSSSTGNILVNRGIIFNPYYMIIVNILTLMISVYIFDFSTLKGILFYSVFAGCIVYFISFLFGLYKTLNLTRKTYK
jgi:O-antigen/teichoic acid export membrane protein